MTEVCPDVEVGDSCSCGRVRHRALPGGPCMALPSPAAHKATSLSGGRNPWGGSLPYEQVAALALRGSTPPPSLELAPNGSEKRLDLAIRASGLAKRGDHRLLLDSISHRDKDAVRTPTFAPQFGTLLRTLVGVPELADLIDERGS